MAARRSKRCGKAGRDLEPFDVAIVGSLKGSINELGLGYEIKRDAHDRVDAIS